MEKDIEETTVLDLFCGAGGFSKGFESAGYKVVAGIDFKENFKGTYLQNHEKSRFIHYDLLNGVLDEFQKGDIDFIIGSPPCQGFSDARGNRDEKNKDHKLRNSLPFRHIEWVDKLSPEIALLENVSGMATIKYGKKMLLELIVEEFTKAGYFVKIGMLNSLYYGVPQERIRIFCLAYKKKYRKILENFPFPLPNYVPQSFKKRKPKKRAVEIWYFKESDENFFPRELNPIRTVRDVISDLPDNPSTSGLVNYTENEKISDYHKYLRKNTKNKVSLHNIYSEPNDDEIKILKNIPEGKIYRSSRFGDRYIGVWDLYNSHFTPNESLIFQFMCRFRTLNGFKTKKNKYTEGYLVESLFKSYEDMLNLMLEYNYFSENQFESWMRIFDKQSFPSPKTTLNSLYEKKWLRIKETANEIAYDINTKSGIRPMYLRLHRDLPSRTILTTSFKVRELVHPKFDRPITFREGARIQSFPDDFEFIGTPNNIATMIGNAVPPLLAMKLGLYYKKIINNIDKSNIKDYILKNNKSTYKLLTEFH